MNLPLVLQRKVRREVDDAFAWWEARRPGLGDAFPGALEQAYERIRATPEAPATVFGEPRHVRLERFPYSVHHRVEPRRVVVLSVLHGKRAPEEGWFRDQRVPHRSDGDSTLGFPGPIH